MHPESTKRQALVVIDLQRDLCYDKRRRDLVFDALPEITRLIAAFAEKSFPIFYTRFELPVDDPQFERFGDRYCVVGTEGADFIDEILPLRGEVVVKLKHSAFYGTDLEDRLRGAGCSKVVLAGLQTQICILTTAADAYHRGFDVVAAEEAVISTRQGARLDALEWIKKYVGDVLTIDQVVAEL
ncbi:MAG: cysteine hydrolase family protein [Desulfobulbaceae bacterium]